MFSHYRTTELPPMPPGFGKKNSECCQVEPLKWNFSETKDGNLECAKSVTPIGSYSVIRREVDGMSIYIIKRNETIIDVSMSGDEGKNVAFKRHKELVLSLLNR